MFVQIDFNWGIFWSVLAAIVVYKIARTVLVFAGRFFLDLCGIDLDRWDQ